MLNICGCLVTAHPDRVGQVIASIDAAEGSEVHAHQKGRIVVTVEDTDAMPASERIMEIHNIPGVISVALTYHHFEETDGHRTVHSSPTH